MCILYQKTRHLIKNAPSETEILIALEALVDELNSYRSSMPIETIEPEDVGDAFVILLSEIPIKVDRARLELIFDERREFSTEKASHLLLNFAFSSQES